jgi:cell wall-associated NlpC family hydrolase
MRLGCLLITLVTVLAMPSAVGAQPARLANDEIALEPPDPKPKPPGRPEVVSIALRYLGIPYRWGGSSPSGFDCSGFVMYVYGQIGIPLPHNGSAQYALGRYVPRDRLQPGDLVSFNGHGHVGIYTGRGRFVHSPHSGDVVKISRLSEGWYRSTYDGARRY